MGNDAVQSALSQGRPYFGPEMAARQGAPRRHSYMQAAVRLLAEEGVRRPTLLEVGSWAGGSAVTLGLALKKYTDGGRLICVDPWRPYFDLSRNQEEVYQRMDRAAREGSILNLFLHNIRACGLEDIVIPMRGQSREILPLLKQEAFHLVFIDGSHSYEDVRIDLEGARRLVRDRGILCGDDLEVQLRDCPLDYTRAMAAEDRDYVPHPSSGAGYHPGVSLALWEAFGEVSVWEGFWGMRRSGDAWARFELPPPEPGAPGHFDCQ